MGKIPWIWRTGRPNPHQFDHEHDDNRPSRGYQHANRSPNPTNRSTESHDDPPNPPTTTAAGSEQGGGKGTETRRSGVPCPRCRAARCRSPWLEQRGAPRRVWNWGRSGGCSGTRTRGLLRFGRRAQRSNPSLASLAAGYCTLRVPLTCGAASRCSEESGRRLLPWLTLDTGLDRACISQSATCSQT